MRVQKLLLDVAKVLAVLLLMGLAVWVYLGWQVEPKLPVLGEAIYVDELKPLSEEKGGNWLYEGYPSEVFTVSADVAQMQIAATQPFTLTYLGYTKVPASYLFQSEERQHEAELVSWVQEINQHTPAWKYETSPPEPLTVAEVGSFYCFDFETLGGTWQISSQRKPLEAGWPKLRLRSDQPFKVYSRTIDAQVIKAYRINSVLPRILVVAVVGMILSLLAVIVIVGTDHTGKESSQGKEN